MMNYRILYAAGPGNIISAHKHWVANQHDPTQVSLTYSSQFEEFCRDIGAKAYIISSYEEKSLVMDGSFILEHRPKPFPRASGLLFHIREILYGIGLSWTAARFGANVAVIGSGTTHYFTLFLLRLLGIKVILALHNTLWPCGYPPSHPIRRLISRIDSFFFRYGAMATIGISAECIRQMDHITGGKHGAAYEFRTQFRRNYFQGISPPPRDQQPFQIMFAARIVREKGAFDVLEIAQKVEMRAPGRVAWEICGGGPDFDELKRQHSMMNLQTVVNLRGWTSPDELCQIISRSHASIVPTRSGFSEGFAKTVAEAILAGRPVITNPVVPGFELLKPACVVARTNDIDSYVEEILKLIENPDEYSRLCNNCPDLQEQFYDRRRGLAAVLKEAVMQSCAHPNARCSA